MSESKTILLAGLVLSAVILGGFYYILASEPFPSSSLVHSEMIPIQPGSSSLSNRPAISNPLEYGIVMKKKKYEAHLPIPV